MRNWLRSGRQVIHITFVLQRFCKHKYCISFVCKTLRNGLPTIELTMDFQRFPHIYFNGFDKKHLYLIGFVRKHIPQRRIHIIVVLFFLFMKQNELPNIKTLTLMRWSMYSQYLLYFFIYWYHLINNFFLNQLLKYNFNVYVKKFKIKS